MQWFKRQGCLVKIVVVGFTASVFLCACIVGLPLIDSDSVSVKTPTPALTTAQLKALARDDITYDSLARDTEAYVGEVVYYRGQVIQVMERSGMKFGLRVNVTEGEFGFWDDVVWVNYEGPRVLEDDIVHIWGRVKGRYKYTTVLGAQIVIPEITVMVLEIE